MNLAELKRVAEAKVSPDRSTFAADESSGAIKKRFEARWDRQPITLVTTARMGAGSLRPYAAPMGAVLRCTHCDGILMRAVHTPHGRWLEMRGARYLGF
jgi:hypothetical protein